MNSIASSLRGAISARGGGVALACGLMALSCAHLVERSRSAFDIASVRGELRLPAVEAGVGERNPRLRIEVATPDSREAVGGDGGIAFVAGRAVAPFTKAPRTDLVFLIDRSESTAESSGLDVDGDGRIEAPPWFLTVFGFTRRTSDSILDAQGLAVRALLANLDPRQTRVALATFSGDLQMETPDAELVVPLTSDYDRVLAGLAEVLDADPEGQTNLLAGLNVASVELLRARASRRARSAAVIVVLTDGLPTLPLRNQAIQNERLTLTTAERAAAKNRIRTHVLAFGNGRAAPTRWLAFVEALARTGRGVGVRVEDPRRPGLPLARAGFSDIEQIEVRSLAPASAAPVVVTGEDGSFGAFVEVEPGENTVVVRARSADGLEETVEHTFTFDAAAPAPRLDESLAELRARLIERTLGRQ